MPFIPPRWLADHTDLPADIAAADLAAALVSVGLEEESITPPPVTGPLVVGKVLSLEPETHKNGKTISYCRVDVGSHNDPPGHGTEPADVASRGIVCGAHNFTVGKHVVVALPGAVLPGDFAITARNTYGHTSDGMICSPAELGLSDDAAGIIVLEDHLAQTPPAPGTDAIDLLGLGDEILEINVTPDRGYCFSMRGVAREYHLSTGAAYTDPVTAITVPNTTGDAFDVKLEDDAPIRGEIGCDRFVTRVVRGIDPRARTPRWMQQRLTQAGMRPISLAVDITNYVMLDLGQPIHAYDLDTLAAPIVVRRARAGEKLTTLDDVERALDPEDLLITDSDGGHGQRILGLAGVMGGAETEVGPATTDVLIEAAHFSAFSVARTARRHKLPSEAAKRFERSVDPALSPYAAQRVVELLVQYGGGVDDTAAVGDVGDWSGSLPAPVLFDPEAASRLVGVNYSTERVIELLRAIGCDVDPRGDTLRVTPPSWRPDLTGPAHLIEEIARLDGYDAIASVAPTSQAGHGLTTTQRRRRDVIRTVAEAGLVEVLSYPFIGDAHDRQQLPADDERRRAIRITNPLADDAPLLRTSLLDSLLDTAQRNVARASGPLALVETGMVTRPGPNTPSRINPGVEARPSEAELAAVNAAVPDQPRHLAAVIGGTQVGAAPHTGSWSATWSDAVSLARRAARAAGATITVEQATIEPFHPGRCAAIVMEGQTIGYAGELHPEVIANYTLPARTAALELDLDALTAAGTDPIIPRAVSTYPAAKEDLAFVVDDALPAAQLEAALREAVGASLEDLRLFDVYRGEQVGEGKKSLAFSVQLRAPGATLSADEIRTLRNAAVAAAEKLGADLRA